MGNIKQINEWEGRKENQMARENKRNNFPPYTYQNYTSINTSRGRILQECINVEFCKEEIEIPK